MCTKFNKIILVTSFSLIIKSVLNFEDVNLLLQMEKIFKYGWPKSVAYHKLPVNFVPPQYISDLYNSISDSKNEMLMPHGSSIIWSFPDQNSSLPNLFQFDLAGLNDLHIIEAELHVFRMNVQTQRAIYQEPHFLLKAYQVTSNLNPDNINPDMHQLLNVQYISTYGSDWQVFRVKRTVDFWQKQPGLNFGILITATTIENELLRINFARNGVHEFKYQPHLVVFTTEKSSAGLSGEKLLSNITMPINLNSKNRFQAWRVNSANNCHKVSMYVNFTEFPFKNIIISPKGFDAFQCIGLCNYPFSMKENSSNHALFQMVLKYLRHTMYDPSCVPVVLKPVFVLYINEYRVIILQKIENAVVETCGCR